LFITRFPPSHHPCKRAIDKALRHTGLDRNGADVFILRAWRRIAIEAAQHQRTAIFGPDATAMKKGSAKLPSMTSPARPCPARYTLKRFNV
jgi:hypothetical protein